jgi:hypothetical protein
MLYYSDCDWGYNFFPNYRINEQIKINNYDNNNYYMLVCNRVGHICLQH